MKATFLLVAVICTIDTATAVGPRINADRFSRIAIRAWNKWMYTDPNIIKAYEENIKTQKAGFMPNQVLKCPDQFKDTVIDLESAVASHNVWTGVPDPARWGSKWNTYALTNRITAFNGVTYWFQVNNREGVNCGRISVVYKATDPTQEGEKPKFSWGSPSYSTILRGGRRSPQRRTVNQADIKLMPSAALAKAKQAGRVPNGIGFIELYQNTNFATGASVPVYVFKESFYASSTLVSGVDGTIIL